MTNEVLEKLKQEYLDHIQKFMTESGSLFAHISIFAEQKKSSKLFTDEDLKPAIVHIPIPQEFLEDDDSKDMFIDEIIPDMMIEVKKNFKPMGIAWASEAWVRVLDKDQATEEQLKNYKEIPIKKEVVIVTIETADSNQCVVYDIIRKGMKVNDDGELTDIVELKEDINLKDMASNTEGRFTGLYKKLKL